MVPDMTFRLCIVERNAIIPVSSSRGIRMTIDRRSCLGMVAATAMAPLMARAAPRRTIALLFDSLISSFWGAAIEQLRRDVHSRGWATLEAVSNMDDNRQFQQLQSMIQRGVDGIVMVHTDDKAVVPAIRAANRA